MSSFNDIFDIFDDDDDEQQQQQHEKDKNPSQERLEYIMEEYYRDFDATYRNVDEEEMVRIENVSVTYDKHRPHQVCNNC